VPLVRSGDDRKAKRNPMAPEDWPRGCDRRRLVDDCWALALANLRHLKEHDRRGAEAAHLAGRNLEPWRAVLGVAHWLQERHGVAGLFERMEKLSVDYQRERGEFEDHDATRVLYRALLTLTRGRQPPEALDVAPKDIAEEMSNIAASEDLGAEGKD